MGFLKDATYVDYHVHYHMDACAHPDMTLPNIEQAASTLGLKEIAVLKHYSAALPNGKEDWVYWHVVKPDQFDGFLRDCQGFRPGLPLYRGVETELVNDQGDINIPTQDADRVDLLMLSVHYLPAMGCIEKPMLYHPRAQHALIRKDPEAMEAYAHWCALVDGLGAVPFIEGLVEGYIKAMERHPKVRVLAHLYDGLLPLRDFHIPCDTLPIGQLVKLFEPMMRAMADLGVLWELLPTVVTCPDLLLRANELGVRFVGTTDAHFITGGWGNLMDHDEAEKYIHAMGLNKGRIAWGKF